LGASSDVDGVAAVLGPESELGTLSEVLSGVSDTYKILS
jgi:hypothetical protein